MHRELTQISPYPLLQIFLLPGLPCLSKTALGAVAPPNQAGRPLIGSFFQALLSLGNQSPSQVVAANHLYGNPFIIFDCNTLSFSRSVSSLREFAGFSQIFIAIPTNYPRLETDRAPGYDLPPTASIL